MFLREMAHSGGGEPGCGYREYLHEGVVQCRLLEAEESNQGVGAGGAVQQWSRVELSLGRMRRPLV